MDFNLIKQSTKNLIFSQANALIITGTPKIVLGLSGGPDSVFLLHVFSELKKNMALSVVAVHLDHEWRQNSANDVQFCATVCQNLGVDFVAAKASDLAGSFKFNGSKEEIGRQMRRFLFNTILHNQNANFIALAHHAQDQQETFFIRLIRGSTLSGLRCMNMVNGKYLRPLLEVSKTDILAYLDDNNIQYLVDPTNTSDAYLRNRIRKYILPNLQKCDTRLDKKFKNTLHQLKLEDDFLQMLAQEKFEKIFIKLQNFYCGTLVDFKQLNPVLQRRVILHWLIKENIKFTSSTNYFEEIIKFLNSNNGGQHVLAKTWMINKQRKKFWITNIN